MKKITILIFMLCYVVSLVGCQSAMSTMTPSATAAAGYTFSYNDVSIAMHADAAPIIAALGEPKSYTEQASCAFDGLDKTYSYGSFSINTYPKDGTDHISQLWFTDDQVSTGEGIRIGDSLAKVEQVYGRNGLTCGDAYILTKGETSLTIITANGLVTSIQYSAIL